MSKNTFLALSLLAAFALAQPAYAGDDTVVATVNGEKIVKKEVTAAMDALKVPEKDRKEAFTAVVQQMINEKLFTAHVMASGIDKSDEYKKRLADTQAQLMKSIYLDGYMKDKVTDKAVKAEYEKFKDQNKGKEEVHARHILVKTEEEAKQVIKDLDAGKKFADLAIERSTDPAAKNGGDLGYFAKGELVPEFSEAAFKLKKGTYTKEPVKTQFGYHVIYVEDMRERAVPELKDLDQAIRNKLAQDTAMALANDLRSKAKIERFDENGKPVADAAPAAPADDKNKK